MRPAIAPCLAAIAVAVALGSPANAEPDPIVGTWNMVFTQDYCSGFALSDCRMKAGDRTWKVRRVFARGRFTYRLDILSPYDGTYTRVPIHRKSRSWVGVFHGSGPYCDSIGGNVGTGTITVSLHADGDSMTAYYAEVDRGACPGSSYSVGRLGRHLRGHRA